jgi:uncharacterized protein
MATFSLYAAIVPSYLQVLRSVAALLGKADAHCTEKGIAAEDLLQMRLAPDMLPFAYQVRATTTHSLGALEAIRRGIFEPDRSPPPGDFPALHARIADTLVALEAVEPAEVDSFVGRDMRFSAGERHMDFTAEDFLLSFSQPNFYFHAATAYDILRWKGLVIGKRDFIGRPRTKT